MKKVKLTRLTRSSLLTFILGLAVVLISHVPIYASSFTWSGYPIAGEAGVEYPNFFPEGEATFAISGSTMTLSLTYTGASEPMSGINQTLTGLIWEMEGFGGTLDAMSALIPSGSALIGFNSGAWTSGADLSGQWCFEDNIDSELVGSFGVGAMGDINFEEDTFGSDDVIDSSKTHVTPAPNGIDFGIVAPVSYIDLGPDPDGPDGFKEQGPVVQNAMVFDFVFSEDPTDITITNVQPLFGSEGAPLVPEPATMLLLGSGLIGLAAFGRKKLFKKS